MQIVPIQPVPNQTLQAQLGGQPCVIHVYQTAYGMFVDLYVSSSLIVCGVIAENLTRIVRSLYLGFSGDLAFYDVQTVNGEGADPVYTGLGSRFLLVYVSADELPDGVG